MANRLHSAKNKARKPVISRRRMANNSTPPSAASATQMRAKLLSWRILCGGIVLAVFLMWAYWPALLRLVSAWEEEPDYSHGYLVVPMALIFLWVRREGLPGFSDRCSWCGLLLILLSIGVRYASALVFAQSVDAWSMLLCVSGIVLVLCGWRALWWSMPSILLLWFMIPLPYRAERWLSLPLQGIATKISCWSLQCLAQPAIAQGHTILLDEHQIEIEEACSGLRIFIGIVALAFVYLVLVRRTWWERALLLASILPVALIANAARVVVTGLLIRFTSGEVAHKFSHDFAGWGMIPFAAALFALVLWYVGKLVREVEPMSVRAVVRRGEFAKLTRPNDTV